MAFMCLRSLFIIRMERQDITLTITDIHLRILMFFTYS